MATAKKSNKATKAAKAARSTKPAAQKSVAKKSTAKRAAAGSPARRAGAKSVAAKRAAAKKTTAKKTTAKKTAKKTAAKKTAAKKTTAKKTTKGSTRAATATKAANKTTAKKTAKKAVKRAKSPFGAKFIADMKVKLLAERAKYLHSAEEYRAEADALIDGREPGDVQFDEEGGEGDTLAVERERDLALSNQARQAVDQIDAALERIANGTYGLCVASGLPIPQERLRAIPWAAERVEYKAGGLGRL